MIRTVTPIFSIVIGILIFLFYTQGQFTDVKQVKDEASRYEQAVATAETRNKELNAKYDAMEAHGPSDIERLNTLVPREIDEVKILTDISELARSHNMLFGNVVASNNELEPQVTVDDGSLPAEFKDLTFTELQFSLIGTYDQFKAFLADVESSLVLLEVYNIGFTTGEGIFQQYSVSVRVYALAPRS